MSNVSFSFHLVSSSDIDVSADQLIPWIEQICIDHGRSIQELSYIFSTDPFILELNKAHLNHDYFTDILTFPYNYDPIHAEIYISLDRVKDNAKVHDTPFIHELLRVIAHGALHMLGYDDRQTEDIQTMRRQEDLCIQSYLSNNP